MTVGPPGEASGTTVNYRGASGGLGTEPSCCDPRACSSQTGAGVVVDRLGRLSMRKNCTLAACIVPPDEPNAGS